MENTFHMTSHSFKKVKKRTHKRPPNGFILFRNHLKKTNKNENENERFQKIMERIVKRSKG